MNAVYIQQTLWRVTVMRVVWHVTSTLKRTITKSTLIWVAVLCALRRRFTPGARATSTVPTLLELQDVPIPWNTHPGAIKDTIFIQMVLSMDSSSTSIHRLLSSWWWCCILGGFLTSISACPGWKQIFLDVFQEHWSWFATVLPTSPPIFQDLFTEALERCLVHPGFTLWNCKFRKTLLGALLMLST